MSLRYKDENTFSIFGSKTKSYADDHVTISSVTITPVTLESSYQAESSTVATKHFESEGFSKMTVDLKYTMGNSETSNTVEIKVEGSPDGITFYQFQNDSTSTGTSTLYSREFTFAGTDGTVKYIEFPIDISSKFIRISAKESGVATNKGTIYGDVTLCG